MSVTAEEAYARPIARLALRVLALTAVRPIEVRGAVWDEFDDLNGAGPLSRISASRMKGDLQRKADRGGDHLVLFTRQAIALLRALGHPPAAAAATPSNRHGYRPISENAIGNLPHRAGYPGSHVSHGFRAAFLTVMNEWAQRNGKGHDRRILDRMRGHGLREPMITRRI